MYRKKISVLAFSFLFLLTIDLGFNSLAFAEPTESEELGDTVCSALLPCSPPTFEVFPGFKDGPCGKLYKTSCDRWKEVKAKADALDIAAEKLNQCIKDKKDKKPGKIDPKGGSRASNQILQK